MTEKLHAPGPDVVVAAESTQDFGDALNGAQRRRYQKSSTGRGSEYIGYYLGPSPPLPMYSRSVVGSPFTGLGIQTGSVSPQVFARVPRNPLSTPPWAPEFETFTSAEI